MHDSSPIRTEDWNVETLLVEELRFPDKSLRTYNKTDIRRAGGFVKQCGQPFPIVVNAQNEILFGELFARAVIWLNQSSVKIIRADRFDQAHQRLYKVAVDQLLKGAGWNKPYLAEELRWLQQCELNFDMETTGFTIAEIDNLTLDLDGAEVGSTVPVTHSVAYTELGDLWQLGGHRLMCASALDALAWSSLLGGDTASLMFTDPPYNVPIDRPPLSGPIGMLV